MAKMIRIGPKPTRKEKPTEPRLQRCSIATRRHSTPKERKALGKATTKTDRGLELTDCECALMADNVIEVAICLEEAETRRPITVKSRKAHAKAYEEMTTRTRVAFSRAAVGRKLTSIDRGLITRHMRNVLGEKATRPRPGREQREFVESQKKLIAFLGAPRAPVPETAPKAIPRRPHVRRRARTRTARK